MIGLSTTELAGFREDANQLLPDTATIYQRTMQADGRGGEVAIWTALATTVQCRLSATSVKNRARDMLRGDRVEPAEGWIISFPLTAPIGEGDRVKINSTFYEVISSADRRSYDINLRLICKRV